MCRKLSKKHKEIFLGEAEQRLNALEEHLDDAINGGNPARQATAAKKK
jgi:hypothetical protein